LRPEWLPLVYWWVRINPKRKCFTCDADAVQEARWTFEHAHLWCDSAECSAKARLAITGEGET
jgi:hypothetical protein